MVIITMIIYCNNNNHNDNSNSSNNDNSANAKTNNTNAIITTILESRSSRLSPGGLLL